MKKTISHRPLVLSLGGAAAALVLAACGGGSSGGNGTNAAPAAPNTSGPAVSTHSGATVVTHSGAHGSYLTDGNGRTLYVFSADTGMRSTCTGDCAKEWVPFTAARTPATSGSVRAADLGTVTRDGGQRQVTYAGHPLYYFEADKSAGQVNGQGLDDFGGIWSTVRPDGSAVTSKASSTPEPSTSSSSSGGYSYY